MTLLEGAGLLLIGFFIGCYGTMVGIGGGFFLVPILLFAHYPARVAAGTSLAVVFANAASGTVSYLRQHRVDLRTGMIFAIASVPGALLGAYVDQHIPLRVFSWLFAVLLITVAVRIVIWPHVPAKPADASSPTPTAAALAVVVAVVAGFLASMFGIGGGIVQVPSMVYLLGFPAHVATATSHFTIALTALFGSASHAYFGDVAALPAVWLAAGAIPGAQLGAAISARIRGERLLRWLSLAIAVAALYLIFERR